MPSLKKMRQRTDDIKVRWGEEDVIVRWRPGMLTDAFVEELAGIYDDAIAGGVRKAMPKVRTKLAELLAWWDLTEEEGPEGPGNPMVPLTDEGLACIPEGLLLAITKEVLEESQGGEASGRTGDGGLAGAPSATSPDGPHSFG